MKPKTVIAEIASRVIAVSNCIRSSNSVWEAKHSEIADQLAKDFLPRGSGVDCGTKIDWDATLRHGGRKIVFQTAFHHMNECGYYDGWTEHKITVSPDWDGVQISVSGVNRNGIKDYLADIYLADFYQPVIWDNSTGRYVRANVGFQS